MERFCWKGHVNPGKLEEYAAKHNAMCRQMEELMRAAGMRNYSIWANGEDTIGYYEYLGPERKAEVYEQHRDILDAWNKNMEGLSGMDLDEDGKPIIPMERMESFCRTNKVLMGIITVPSEHAQEVCDRMIACGIKAIWNFAPVHLDVPGNILVQNENMATSLAVLSMHLQAQIKEKK